MKRNPRRDLVLVKDVLKAIHCVEDFIGDKEFDGFATKEDFSVLKKDLISAMEKVFPTRDEMDAKFDAMH